MKVKRGDVVLLDHPFSTGIGSKVRPVLIVQGDRDNTRLTNTIVAMITRTVQRADRLDTQILLDVATPEGQAAGIKATSAVNCSHLFTVSEKMLRKKIGHLSTAAMNQINACLKAALEIP